MRLDWYIARRFTWTFSGVFFVFLLILGFIGLVEQMRRFSSTEADFTDIAVIALLELPKSIYTILPLIMIISTIALFLGLSRSSEMVVTRAAGRSALRALVPVVTVSLVIGIISVAIANPIVASTARQFEIRSDQIRGSGSILSLGSSGLWLRQGNDAGQTVIRAATSNLDGTVLQDVTFITFSPEGRPTRRISADKAQLNEGAWQLFNVKSWPLIRSGAVETAASDHKNLNIPSTLTADQIRDSFGAPSSISIWELPAFIERLKTAGFAAKRHSMWYQMELTLPLFLVSMVLIGAAFTLRHQRGGRTGLMVLIAILLSFSIYFLRNFVQILGENGQLPIVLAAWAPPLAAIGLAMGLLLHNEDG